MKAAVARKLGTIEIEDVDQPVPSFGEVLVKIGAVGICQTDHSALSGSIPVPMPMVLGHEGAGIVESVGAGVTHVQPGDHVVLSITAGCGRCSQCQTGAFTLCHLAAPHVLSGTMLDGTTRLSAGGEPIHSFFFQGSFAEYAVVPALSAVRIRQDAPLDVAALLACGASTGYGAVIRAARVRPGSSVLVIGGGGVGLSATMAARYAGAAHIVVMDRSSDALKLASEIGASEAVLSDGTEQSIIDAVTAVVPGGVDVALDTVGTPTTLAAAFAAVRPGGTAVAIGMADATSSVSVPIMSLIFEKRLTGTYNGSIRPHVDIPAALDAFMAGQLPLDRLVQREISLAELPSVFSESGPGRCGRTVVKF
jgi:alcohol dehydrogenase